jgi:hypothetical protein
MMSSNIIRRSLYIALCLGSFPLFPPVNATPTVQVSQSIWKLFNSPDEKFRILFPGEPEQFKQNINSQVGPLELRMFMVERKQDGVGYAVGYTEYPQTYIDVLTQKNIIEKALDSAKDGALKNSQGTLLSETKINLGSYAGRELKYTKPGKIIATHRIYLVENRLYQVIVETKEEKEKILTKSISGFFNSFKLEAN